MAVAFEQTLRSLSLDTRGGNELLLGAGLLVLALWAAVAVTLPLPRVLESADGRIVSALEPARIVAGTDEQLEEIAVRLGDEVARGDLLVRFDQASLKLELASREQRLASYRRQLEEIAAEFGHAGAEHERRLDLLARAVERIEARVAETQASIEYAEFRARTYDSLRSDRVIDALEGEEAQALLKQQQQRLLALRIEADEVRADREVAMAQWRAASARYRRTEAELAGQVAELVPQLEQLRHEIDRLEIRAPYDGVVEGIAPVSAGQTLPRDAWLMTLSPRGDFQFEARFLATEAAARIKSGARARIAFTALPWTEYGTLDATVSRVGNEQRAELITVQLDLAGDNELLALLGHGLTGRAIVEVDRITLLQRLLQLIARPAS